MEEITIDSLDYLIAKGRKAVHYAMSHYEELCDRKKTYTLYGPDEYAIRIGLTGVFIPKSSKKLSKQTRRKHYNIYELDKNFHLLRTVTMWNHHEIRYSYQCFEMDGIQFSCPFSGFKQRFRDHVLAISYHNLKPHWFAFMTANSIRLEIYDYTSPTKTLVRSYLYSQISKYSWSGYPVDASAQIGSITSPVAYGSWEETAVYTDFSEYFEHKTGDGVVSSIEPNV